MGIFRFRSFFLRKLSNLYPKLLCIYAASVEHAEPIPIPQRGLSLSVKMVSGFNRCVEMWRIVRRSEFRLWAGRIEVKGSNEMGTLSMSIGFYVRL